MRSAEELAPLMAGFALGPAEQVAQIAFRMDLAESWHLLPGMRVLEIGCGQGDMTAVLADAVGGRGKVVAVDVADPSYGAPITLGESAAHLMEGELGERIEFRFGVDVLDPSVEFGASEFDAVVLALCTWYFESLEQVAEVLERVREWAPRLHMAEWNMQPASIDQLGHLMAVLIQGQVEARRGDGTGNVRTPYSRERLIDVLGKAGWAVESDHLVATAGLADARWEIDLCLEHALADAETVGFTMKERQFLASQLDVLRRLEVGACLPAYALSAVRCHDSRD